MLQIYSKFHLICHGMEVYISMLRTGVPLTSAFKSGILIV